MRRRLLNILKWRVTTSAATTWSDSDLCAYSVHASDPEQYVCYIHFTKLVYPRFIKFPIVKGYNNMIFSHNCENQKERQISGCWRFYIIKAFDYRHSFIPMEMIYNTSRFLNSFSTNISTFDWLALWKLLKIYIRVHNCTWVFVQLQLILIIRAISFI